MSKLRVVVVFVAIAFVLPVAVSGQKVKPPKPLVTAMCTIAGEVQSGDAVVIFGRDIASYGPMDQALYIHESLLPPSEIPDLPGVVASLKAAGSAGGFYGRYYGQIRPDVRRARLAEDGHDCEPGVPPAQGRRELQAAGLRGEGRGGG